MKMVWVVILNLVIVRFGCGMLWKRLSIRW